MEIDAIIERLGGAEAAARLTGVGIEAVRKWRQARAVPSRHWPAVVAATGLGFADLQEATSLPEDAPPAGATAALVLADGTVFWGLGFGAAGTAPSPAELCFNTGMTGYQETLTDPSYAAQVIVFTFPHIGNAGTNPDDHEAAGIAARGLVVKAMPTAPSNWRSRLSLEEWLRQQEVAGIAGVDTRALTIRIRAGTPPSGVLAYPAAGGFDLPALRALAAAWPGLDGMELAAGVSGARPAAWGQGLWQLGTGFADAPTRGPHVVAVDYGAKSNILRCLADCGCRVTVVPAESSGEAILALRPDGVFLSNGPGDPAATAAYAVPAIRAVLEAALPVFGICLGHQLLALALGARTFKLARGHHGANQPVREVATGRVEITSQNHGFAVAADSLPAGVVGTHVSLFDGSNEGLACAARRAFSVQYHPEACPGPGDARHLFGRFRAMMGDAEAWRGGNER